MRVDVFGAPVDTELDLEENTSDQKKLVKSYRKILSPCQLQKTHDQKVDIFWFQLFFHEKESLNIMNELILQVPSQHHRASLPSHDKPNYFP